MPDIRYVILSDLHFGAENSILTQLKADGLEVDPHNASEVMKALVDCLAGLIGRNEAGSPKPTLILCGDVLELALATDNIAAMVFERFVELIFPAGGGDLFDRKIYFVPGNHDHHLWETARERQYEKYLRQDEHGPGTELEIPWHVTRMIPKREEEVEAGLLTTLIRRYPHLGDVTVLAVYPNLRLVAGDRHVVVHHGHYVEGMYKLMSTLKDLVFPGRPPADQIYDWEGENFAWIDFFWSTLGRSGDVGKDVGLIYASLQNEPAMRRLARDLATGIAGRLKVPTPVRWVARPAIRFGLGKVVDRASRLERSSPSTDPLSDGARAGLNEYLRLPLLDQLRDELKVKDPPADITFVFGHTHKPFELSFPKPDGYSRPIPVYNTGGWVVDNDKPAPMQGGAAILFDEDLNAASLRLYNQERYRPYVAAVPGSGPNPFLERLAPLVDPASGPWAGMAAAAETLVKQRRLSLDALIKRGQAPS